MKKSTSLALVAIAGMVGAVACGSSTSGVTTTSSGSSSSSSGTPTTTSGSGSSSSGSGSGSSSSGAPVGLAADILCTGGKNAFETYGAAAFLTVNQNIFNNVFAELGDAGTTNLGDSFSVVGTSGHDGLNDFEGTLAALLVFEYGGPASITFDGGTYQGSGQDLSAEHKGLAITSDQYDYFVSNIVVPALSSAGVPTTDITKCFAPLIAGTLTPGSTVKSLIVNQ